MSRRKQCATGRFDLWPIVRTRDRSGLECFLSMGPAPASQSLMCFFTDLMNRPKALSFLRLSRYDIPWYSDSLLSLI